MRMKSKRLWAAGVLLLALAVAFFVWRGAAEAVVARVYQDGVLLREIDLQAVPAPYEFTIEGAHGVNTIRVEQGRICVLHADCPDKTCVRQGWITNGLLPAVCLPNKLVIQVENARADDALDAVTR